MARTKGETDIEDILEWISRMEIEAEDAGLAADDEEWLQFIRAHFEAMEWREPSAKQMAWFREARPTVEEELGYRTERLATGQLIFRSITGETRGQFVSRETAKTAWDLFTKTHGKP